jgi:hypothetical protein
MMTLWATLGGIYSLKVNTGHCVGRSILHGDHLLLMESGAGWKMTGDAKIRFLGALQ